MKNYLSLDSWKNAVTKAWEAIDIKAIGYMTFETLDNSPDAELIIAHCNMPHVKLAAGLYDKGKGSVYNDQGEPNAPNA